MEEEALPGDGVTPDLPDEGVLEALPSWVWQVPYDGSRVPGAAARDSWRDGANCQLFAYGVLALHGFQVADLRSDELWADSASTELVGTPRPLDLVLFGPDEQPYGAHVGLVVGDDAVLHLCKEVGRPVVWSWGEFAQRLAYRVVIGFKRPVHRRR